jgi:hypothetical protein
MVAEELRRRGWREAELTLRRKTDPEKVETAWRLRRETTMTLKWIAKRLKMAPRRTGRTAWSKSGNQMKSVNSYDRYFPRLRLHLSTLPGGMFGFDMLHGRGRSFGH